MNFGGNFPVIQRDICESEKIWQMKRWYILYAKPETNSEFNTTLSMANLYINKNYEDMSYSVPNINGILEHLDLNLV
jgi:hypothetical protein